MREDHTTTPEPGDRPRDLLRGGQAAHGPEVSISEFVCRALQSDTTDVPAAIDATVKARYQPRTTENYDYWWGRLTNWMDDPTKRHRFRNLGPVNSTSLLPMTPESEQLVMLWLLDTTHGPVDPDELEIWLSDGGPIAPGTLTNAMSALKFKAIESETPWIMSTRMTNYLKGLRRELRKAAGPTRQAEPLLNVHVRSICERLADLDPSWAARDRLVLELHIAGVTPSEVGRLTRNCIAEADSAPAADSASDNELLYRSTGTVATRSLIIPGQNRRGGHQDPARVIALNDHPNLELALDAHLSCAAPTQHRDTCAQLIRLTPSNPCHHVRKILIRLAELSEIPWRPGRNALPTPQGIRAMRRLFDEPAENFGQLQQKRDHVMILVGYACALRRSELCALTVGDVRFTSENAATITIQFSKTDQSGRGAILPLRQTDSAPPALATVTLLRRWIEKLIVGGASPATPLFPALDRHGNVLERLHKKELRSYPQLDPETWSKRLRQHARDAQVFGDDEQRYASVSGHSLRRGFVTSAILAGYETSTIMAQTRHKDLQSLQIYADQLRLLHETDWSKAHFGDLNPEHPND